VREICHLIDLLPTCLDLAGAAFPQHCNGAPTTPLAGVSLTPVFLGKPLRRGAPLFWEHEGHRAVRDGKWKLVASFNEPWELFDMEADRVESNDLSQSQPEIARNLASRYEEWARRAGVKPWPVLPSTPAEKKPPGQSPSQPD